MQCNPRILINQLFFAIPETLVQFEGLTLAFEQRRYGIVGDNGLGKTTLLKLIAHLITPQQGSIQQQGSLTYSPQNYEPKQTKETLAETLNIAEKLAALAQIKNGSSDEKNYALIGDDWDIEATCKKLLAAWNLIEIDLNRPFLSLSGGQQTKCLLIRSLLSKADFILFDEPTNNLDLESRKLFYQWVKKTSQGLLIVSHDRTLLNEMDEIIEISRKGLQIYGGNYAFYQEQKAIQQNALEKQLVEAKRKIKQTEQSVQSTREKHEQRQKKGKALRTQGKIDKITANSMRGRSERSQSRNSTQADQMLQQAETRLQTAKEKIEIKEQIHADLSATRVPKGKIVLEIEEMSFGYSKQNSLFSDFSFSLIGPERVALAGNNGSGKTTLVNLILGKIKPQNGNIKRGVDLICYLDQKIDFLNPALSLLENYQQLNPGVNIRDAYFALASFNFRNKDAEKRILDLSGGERIRAGLAISLLAKTPPQFIILDEPTNHLDIRSIEAIENMLNAYEGAILVISHDQQFLKNININREIRL